MCATATRFEPIGRSPAIEALTHLLRHAGPSDCTVLLLGETGTGKERAARHLHELSSRRAGPFVPVNCGAIPAELFESELFGHEKGAFTGALTTRVGRFELADSGTLFLDEVGELPLAMQVKLLRVLQERCVERVGASTSVRCSVRIIAATNRDLEQRVRDGRFREDLFYRLNVFPITLPPMRERGEDLPQLIAQLMPNGARVRLSAPALEALAQYSWPGNVRELENLLERLSILYPAELIEPSHLPRQYRGAAGTSSAVARASGPLLKIAPEAVLDADLDLKAHLSRIEERLIRQALEEANGVVAEAARMLRLRRTTLVEKLRRFDDLPHGGTIEHAEKAARASP